MCRKLPPVPCSHGHKRLVLRVRWVFPKMLFTPVSLPVGLTEDGHTPGQLKGCLVQLPDSYAPVPGPASAVKTSHFYPPQFHLSAPRSRKSSQASSRSYRTPPPPSLLSQQQVRLWSSQMCSAVFGSNRDSEATAQFESNDWDLRAMQLVPHSSAL